jgi:hypothetical protein
MIAPPTAFDVEGDTMPDWLVDGVIERGTVTVLSGDTSSGKSILADALTVAVLKGTPWLGRDVCAGRVLYIDEENHRRLVQDRLRALGLTSNVDLVGLRYYLRAGVALGEPESNEWLAGELEDYRADLVVIDTATSATAGDVNDNSRVATLYREALRPAAAGGAAVLLLHHERKTSSAGYRNASQAMMGARQWAGQADAHIAIKATGKLAGDVDTDGVLRERYPIEMETPKVRDGQPALPARLAIVSGRDTATRRLISMDVVHEGAKGAKVEPFLAPLLGYLKGRGAVSRGEIAKALEVLTDDGRLARALKAGKASGALASPQHGMYEATS